MNPDCRDGKHRSCGGDGWDEIKDQPAPCPCNCHKEKAMSATITVTNPPPAHLPPLPGPGAVNLAHVPVTRCEHFYLCPCGGCQTIRAAQPVVTAMQAKHLSGASIGKLVEYTTSRSLTTNEHLWSPGATLSRVSHGHEEVAISLQWDDYGIEEIDLNPDDWVRVTAPAAGQVTA